MLNRETVYLDHASATPIRQEVLDRILPFLTNLTACPSGTHSASRRAGLVIEDARRAVQSCLGCQHGTLRFTESGKQANRLAILGLALGRSDKKGHIIATADECESTLQACSLLEGLGYRVSYLPLDKAGRLDPIQLERALTDDTVLVTISMVNRFTGCKQEMDDIIELVRRHPGTLLHTDATLGCLFELDATDLGVDALTLSGHTIYGPQGVGALWARKDVTLNRAFVESKNVASVVGFTEALCYLADERPDWQSHLGALKRDFQRKLEREIPQLKSSRMGECHPGILVVKFGGLDHQGLLDELDHRRVCVSVTPYGVRFSFGRNTNTGDLDFAVDALKKVALRLDASRSQLAA